VSLYNLDWSDDDDQTHAPPDTTFDWNAASLVAQYLVGSHPRAPLAVDGARGASSRFTVVRALAERVRARTKSPRPTLRAPSPAPAREQRARACVAPRPPPSSWA